MQRLTAFLARKFVRRGGSKPLRSGADCIVRARRKIFFCKKNILLKKVCISNHLGGGDGMPISQTRSLPTTQGRSAGNTTIPTLYQSYFMMGSTYLLGILLLINRHGSGAAVAVTV